MGVAVDDVWKSYRLGRVSTPILKGVSFSVSEGEFVGILGPSGSGKSTLVMLLAGIDTPDRGRIVVDGVEVSSLPLAPGPRGGGVTWALCSSSSTSYPR